MKWRSGLGQRIVWATIIGLGLILLASGILVSAEATAMKRRDAHRAFGKVSGRDTSVAR
jgi:hypothetical protein